MTALNLPDEHVDWAPEQWGEWSKDFANRVAADDLAKPLRGSVAFAMDELLKCYAQPRFEELLDLKLSFLRRDLVNHWENEFCLTSTT